jgi:dTMP kinase
LFVSNLPKAPIESPQEGRESRALPSGFEPCTEARSAAAGTAVATRVGFGLRLARLDESRGSSSAAAAGAPMTAQATAKGRFITLEGGEGVGKSVQAGRLEERLGRLGLAVVRTREPGGSPGAEALREAILTGFAADFNPSAQALLFSAARVDHLDKTIVPALARGAWVVSDRFADSTRAYQGAAGNLPKQFIASLERLTVGANQPDLTLVLDLDPEVGLKRATKRRQTGPADRFESEGLPFHQTLRRAFLDIAAAEPRRCAVIDADRSEDEVAAAIWSVVEGRLDPAGALKAKKA